MPARLDRRFLDLLVCPLTKAPLRLDPTNTELRAKGGRFAYPVRDGVAILLPSEARLLSDERPATDVAASPSADRGAPDEGTD